jgi:hypothetical protein
MNILRVSIVMLFIATLSNVAFAGQVDDKHEDKGGTQGAVDEPDCEYTSAREYL